MIHSLQSGLGKILEGLLSQSTLDELLGLLDRVPVSASRVTSDSRQVVPGTIFVAIQGESQDGHAFIDAAVERGAGVILGERGDIALTQVPYVRVSDGRMALSRLVAEFYGNPSESMTVVGITGTSGKTTTSYLMESILAASGFRVGVIGTVNTRFGSKVFPSEMTTPGPEELQRLLFQMKEEGCTAVVMEVSSHALKQRRVSSISFDGMIFTNLSQDHLDFHPDMEDYFRSKAILFTELAQYSRSRGKDPVGVICSEDEYGKRLIQEASLQVFGFSSDLDPNRGGLTVTVEGIRGEVDGIQIQSRLSGKFNCLNILGAVNLAQRMKISASAISSGVSQLVGVPGRLERVENSRGIHVWVDYAHKPDALEKVIKALRESNGFRRLITVFGCGGDRDRKKRPLMGCIAVKGSDHVVITSDNPRTEDPMSIIYEIREGILGFENYTIEPDRKKAIFHAIQLAKPGDSVLIAGKGHEDYQILGTKKIHFDDREVALQAFS